jgi:hypothetical protein
MLSQYHRHAVEDTLRVITLLILGDFLIPFLAGGAGVCFLARCVWREVRVEDEIVVVRQTAGWTDPFCTYGSGRVAWR